MQYRVERYAVLPRPCLTVNGLYLEFRGGFYMKYFGLGRLGLWGFVVLLLGAFAIARAPEGGYHLLRKYGNTNSALPLAAKNTGTTSREGGVSCYDCHSTLTTHLRLGTNRLRNTLSV